MELYIVLILYFIVFICLIFTFYKSSIKITSSVILSLIFSQILLNILKPPSEVNPEKENLSLYSFYILIQFLTPIIIFIYAIVMAFSDTNNKVCKIVKKTCNSHIFDFM